MCGIAGYFNLSGEPVNRNILQAMAKSIAHRGPDGEGLFMDGNFALAHRRLSILDVSDKGAQPMMSKDGRWVISFNGCIYNFQELKLELRSKGSVFISNSDTEVIAEGLSIYGTDFFKRFNGMFAIAAWDSTERCLYLIRDRFGVKPLYYYFTGTVILFGSEIKAFYKHPEFRPELNIHALNEYFTFQNLFSFNTLFKGVALLPPANIVRIDRSSTFVKHNSWWDYNFSEPDDKMSFMDAKEETLRLFKQAVSRQMISDVPVGAYLSGGMDSGSIVSVASGFTDRLTTFTCGFDMSSVTGIEANYDERRDAELMSSIFNTEQYEQVINAGDLRLSLPKVVWHLEDLRVGMSYPNYYISRLASKFVKVCLQGTGGDELYGGYPWRYYKVSGSLSKEDFFNQYYGFWQRLVSDEDKRLLFTDAVSKKNNPSSSRQIFENVFLFNKNLKYDTPEDHIQNSLYFEIKTFLHGLLLVGDKLSMANGLEERFPFLDNDLVSFAQKIPVKHKLGDFEKIHRIDENIPKKKKYYEEYTDGKNVLRQAMSNLIPDAIINRKKQGFSAPDENWYRGENYDYIKELLLSNKTHSSEYINTGYIQKVLDEHVNRGLNHRLLIWSFMNFELWLRKFLV